MQKRAAIKYYFEGELKQDIWMNPEDKVAYDKAMKKKLKQIKDKKKALFDIKPY